MLVLSRRQGESLIVGDDIHLVVLGISGNQVRFGIKAPGSVKIWREEVYQRVKALEAQNGNATDPMN